MVALVSIIGCSECWQAQRMGRSTATVVQSHLHLNLKMQGSRSGGGSSSSSFSSSMDRHFAKRASDILIESPSMNSRRITANTIIEGSPEDVWSILTDYDNLSTHIPNLVQSNLVRPTSYPSGITLFQEGTKKIMGFNFSASLTMNIDEVMDEDGQAAQGRKILFKLVDNGAAMFSSFDGEWTLKLYSRSRAMDPVSRQQVYKYKTQLTYSVFVQPKGIVPVIALEWRIREDIPLNLLAVKRAAEGLHASGQSTGGAGGGAGSSGGGGPAGLPPVTRDQAWYSDETLGSYMGAQASRGSGSGGAGSGASFGSAGTCASPDAAAIHRSTRKEQLQALGRDAWGRVSGPRRWHPRNGDDDLTNLATS